MSSPTSGSYSSNGAFKALVQPVAVTCVNGMVELQVMYATFDIPGVMNFSTRLYSYNGQPMHPGPSIHVQAGTTCTIRIKNQLSTNTAVSSCNYHANNMHCPDTTNLHIHGPHVSPDEDNINTTVLPGEYLDYTYTIPSNHLMGTYWYHAHKHGSAALQVAGGMAGMLFVDPLLLQ